MEEVEKYMKYNLRETTRNTLENLLKYEFPQLKNLKILDGKNGNFSIQFDEGSVLAEDVSNKINEYINGNK